MTSTQDQRIINEALGRFVAEERRRLFAIKAALIVASLIPVVGFGTIVDLEAALLALVGISLLYLLWRITR